MMSSSTGIGVHHACDLEDILTVSSLCRIWIRCVQVVGKDVYWQCAVSPYEWFYSELFKVHSDGDSVVSSRHDKWQWNEYERVWINMRTNEVLNPQIVVSRDLVTDVEALALTGRNEFEDEELWYVRQIMALKVMFSDAAEVRRKLMSRLGYCSAMEWQNWYSIRPLSKEHNAVANKMWGLYVAMNYFDEGTLLNLRQLLRQDGMQQNSEARRIAQNAFLLYIKENGAQARIAMLFLVYPMTWLLFLLMAVVQYVEYTKYRNTKHAEDK